MELFRGPRICGKRIETVPCPSVRPSVLFQEQRAPQQQSRAAAGDAHCQVHMTRGPRKFCSDSKEVQHTCEGQS